MIVSNALSVVPFVLILALYWIVSSAYNIFRPGLRHIPGPWPAKFSQLWRFWFVYNGSAHEGYRKIHQKYGPIVRTAPNVVDISDPAAIHIIYGINSKFLKNEFYDMFVLLYKGENLVNLFSTRDPEHHKALKRPVAQKYSMTSIRSLEYLVDPCSKIFMDAMMELQGEIVDLGTWLQWYAFDVIGEITFSKRFGFMEQRKDLHNIIAGLESGTTYGGMFGQIPSLHRYLLGNHTVNKVLTKVTGGAGNPMPVIDQMIQDAMKQYDRETADTPDREDFLAHLRSQQVKENVQMSSMDFMGHLTGTLLAGSDTTAIALRAVFYYLLKNKYAYQKLQEEIDQANVAGKLSPIITYGESLELEYLQVCLKEAMRMHPGVQYPLERRVPSGGTKLCGRYLPAGTTVGMNAAVIHRNTDVFGADANKFRPERWLNKDEQAIKMMDRCLLTFGAGVRTCIGKNISIMEMGKLVPQILRQFELEWASTEAEWRIHTFWFAKQSGLHVRMRPRAAVPLLS